MSRPVLAAALLLSAVSASAQQPAKPDAEKIYAEVSLDINGDGLADRAELVVDDGEFHLRIYLGRKTAAGGDETVLAIEKREIGVAGGMAGNEPSLEVKGKGSLLLTTQNSAIGRNRWERTLTIVHRNGRFLIGGINYSHYDTIDLANSGACEFNLLTGKGTRNKRAVSGLKPVTLEKFEDELVYKLCP